MEDVGAEVGARRPQDWSRWASAWLPLAGYVGAIVWLSSRPGSTFPRWEIPGLDKIVHGIEYFGLSALTLRALVRSSVRFRWAALVSVVAAVLFGVLDEWHQSFVPGRTGNDAGDLTADALGATLGTLALTLLWRPFPARWRAEKRWAGGKS